MDVIDCIKTRRSRRLFLSKEVPQDKIREIIECAIRAPSSMDCQPWHFVIVGDREAKEKLAKLKSEDNQRHILTAPVSIVVCVDTEKSKSRHIEDGVCAIQNILLAVHSLGLGSVYITGDSPSNPKVTQEIRKILSIPANILPVGILPVGHPDDEEMLEEKSLPSADSTLHYEKW